MPCSPSVRCPPVVARDARSPASPTPSRGHRSSPARPVERPLPASTPRQRERRKPHGIETCQRSIEAQHGTIKEPGNPGTHDMVTFERFRELAKPGTLVPVWRDVLVDTDTAVSAFAKIRRPPFAFLLESAPAGSETWSRYTFMGTEPRAAWRLRDGRVDTWTPQAAGPQVRRAMIRSRTCSVACAPNGRRTCRNLAPSGPARSATSATTSCARSSDCLRRRHAASTRPTRSSFFRARC